ncbi:MAG TPA: hypothetical protein VGQ39_02665 [Pyrinomonadaceae bacterium]|jgi:hypothetical protein|nr:hypothetical protein [Pyrinomonadaceae bacterium]
MNCQRFENLVGELARGQMMEADVRAEALTHIAECSKCSTRLHNEEMLTRGLRSLAIEMNSFAAPSSIEARLLNAFRQPQVIVPLPAAHVHRRYWLAAVAALLLIVFSVVAVRWNQSQAPQRQIVAAGDTPKDELVVSSTPSPEPTTTQSENKTPRPNPRPKRNIGNASFAGNRNAQAKDNDVVANHVNNEIATDFMPLGYMNAAVLQDGGQIVRVELPRTALANFGLPVNMDRYNEKVKADVLLGVDGMAHAIRFVQDKRLQ